MQSVAYAFDFSDDLQQTNSNNGAAAASSTTFNTAVRSSSCFELVGRGKRNRDECSVEEDGDDDAASTFGPLHCSSPASFSLPFGPAGTHSIQKWNNNERNGGGNREEDGDGDNNDVSKVSSYHHSVSGNECAGLQSNMSTGGNVYDDIPPTNKAGNVIWTAAGRRATTTMCDAHHQEEELLFEEEELRQDQQSFDEARQWNQLRHLGGEE